MRMLMKALMPNDAFNAAVRDGSVGTKIGRILEDLKPETVYFTEEGGQRCSYLLVDVANPSQVPALAEPWFLTFNARVEFHIVMSREELGQSGIEHLGKKYAR